MKNTILISILCVCFSLASWQHKMSEQSESTLKLKALIIDGENNHGVWPKTTMMMKDFLEQTGMFDVDIERTAFTWQGPHYDKSIGLEDIKELLTMYPLGSGEKTTAMDEPVPDPDYSPKFDNYNVVITNFGWKASAWSDATKKNFEKYMSEGGGLVVIHAANNSWGDWPEYNNMIGLGGWGGRNTESGPYVYYDKAGQLQYDTSEGNCGAHGAQSEYIMNTRAPKHPIMKGLPSSWLHTMDELYERLRGPAENMTVLATAYSDSEKDPDRTGRHEPLLFTINYAKGRVFHSGLGHMDYSMECVGFMTTFQRGAEWAATGKVTQKVPDDFPGTQVISARKWNR
ncbi:MAG: ThuA domain-containing protein [Bacteroidetes bacterium]|nr:ThuA domain-containing protein [Bacteroidota bacterium]MDA1122268.1 ThuA domain-containing protein [Bacteroidota bacterium]